MRFLRKMFSGKLGRALMPIVSIILFLWLVQSSMGPDTDISDVVQEIFNTVSSSASMTETEPDRNNFETSNTGTSQTNNSESVGDSLHAIKTNPSDFISVSDIPAYSGDAYVAVNDNVPYFTDEDYSTEPFEYYSDLDSLGRCGLTYAVVCQETMPTERRESISEVKPSGWKNQKYDFVDGGWVFNRCHLIGFQLSAENANKCNLITGTRYLNIEGRVEASLIHHNDGKCFSKSKSPEDVPELCVGVLLDQSESTMGEIINYERLLALTIEDMCRSIEIPAIINGYSGGGGTVRIISYVEPNSVDRKNALRLTSMRADGGTPTAEALAYILNRLEKRPEPSKILFVVTDGNSNNKAYLPMLLAEAKRNHIMVIAAGIGACRQSIHSEFPENFLDISDMNSMPRNICNIIKRKLVN